MESKQRDWENTIGDLTRELKYVQGELSEKEGIFSRVRVEQELRQKLQSLDIVHVEKTELHRRIEDLSSEVHHL